MERRWFALAISAHTKGALDFSKVTKYDTQSLIKEKLVFIDLERERRIDFKIAKCWYSMINLLDKSVNMFGSWADGEKDSYYKQLFPWIVEDSPTNFAGDSKLQQILRGFK